MSSDKLILISLAFRKTTPPPPAPLYSFSNHIHILILAYGKGGPCWRFGPWGGRGIMSREVQKCSGQPWRSKGSCWWLSQAVALQVCLHENDPSFFVLGKLRKNCVCSTSDNHILHTSFWYSTEADSVANCALKDIHRLVLAKWSHTLAIPSVGCCQIIFPLLSLWMKEREKYQKDQKISGKKRVKQLYFLCHLPYLLETVLD